MINRWYEPLVSFLFLLYGGWQANGGGADDHTSRGCESRYMPPLPPQKKKKNTSIQRVQLFIVSLLIFINKDTIIINWFHHRKEATLFFTRESHQYQSSIQLNTKITQRKRTLTRVEVRSHEQVSRKQLQIAIRIRVRSLISYRTLHHPLERLLPQRVWFTCSLIYTDYGPRYVAKQILPSSPTVRIVWSADCRSFDTRSSRTNINSRWLILLRY